MNFKKVKRQQQQIKNIQQIQVIIRNCFFACVFLLLLTFYVDESVLKKSIIVSNKQYISLLLFLWDYRFIWFHVCIIGLIWHLWHLAQLVHWLQHLQPQLKPQTYSQFWTFLYDLLEEKLLVKFNKTESLNEENQSLLIILEHIPYPLIELKIENTADKFTINFTNNIIQWCNLATAKLFDIKRRNFYDKKVSFLFEKQSFKTLVFNEVDLFTQQLFSRELNQFNKIDNNLYQKAGETIILEKVISLNNLNSLSTTVHQQSNQIQKSQRIFLLLTPVIIAKRLFLLIQNLTQQYEQQLYEKTLLSHISHELKTPLAVIQNGLETLNQEELEIIPQKETPARMIYDNIMKLVFKETDRMHELISDLLEFQALNSQTIQHEPILLHQLIESSIETASHIGHKNQIIYQNTASFNIRGSKKEWLSILGNLLQNAQKYTQGIITVSIETTSEQIQININDQGEGIEIEHLPFLFDPFYRIPAKNKPQGSGLGLAIVKKLIERQQGTIKVVSEIGVGSCFSVIIPYT